MKIYTLLSLEERVWIYIEHKPKLSYMVGLNYID